MWAVLEFFVIVWMTVIDFFRPNVQGPLKEDTPRLRFYNTLSGTLEDFSPRERGFVKMYNCGPTVYAPQHIGNLSKAVFDNTVRRALEYFGYSVKQVINFTDVGHLVSDADEGEDKMTKGLKRQKLALTLENMKKLGKQYADVFLQDLSSLNIDTTGTTFPFASDYIPAQIAIIQALEEKAYAYRGKDGVYYDTSRFPDYGKLGNIDLAGLKAGARVDVVSEKRNPTDFLLWKFDKKIGWDSPWGKGFPGWHIECSAMARALLGDQLDIHTGGVDHIAVHHNNEIAQSEAAFGKKPFSRYWLHRAHLQMDGGKISKSKGATLCLSDIIARGFHPISFRYLLLGSHYRQSASFTWDALKASQNAFLKLRRLADTLPEGGSVAPDYERRFAEKIADDLDTPGALAVMYDMLKDPNLEPKNMRTTLLRFDAVFGLGLGADDADARVRWEKEFGTEVVDAQIPQEVKELLDQRDAARNTEAWDEADRLRAEIESRGYEIKDTASGVRVVKR
jgi:cysteinyl-tRNA synthetase